MRRLWRTAGLCVLLLSGVRGLGSTAETPENVAEALRAQRSVVEANPTDVAALNDLGNLLALSGDLVEAADIYGRAVEIEPENTTPRYNLALVLAQLGERKEAIEELKRVVEIEPRHAWAHYQLGNHYLDQRRRSKAISEYELAFSIDHSLTDPGVNPHIVENRLVAESLLRAYQDRSPAKHAPKLYLDPGSVASMLLPETPLPAESESGATPEAERHRAVFPPTESGESSTIEQELGTDSDAGGTPSVQPDTDDLGSGAAVPESTSAAPGSQSPRQPTATSTTDSARTPAAPPAGTAVPQRAPSAQPRAPTSRTDATPPPAGSETFRPTRSSTGRLDLELLPAPDPPDPIAAS